MTTPARLEPHTRRLAANDPAVQESFEQLFYRGFAHATHNRLIQTLWEWDVPNRRLRTRIPYTDQAIWARCTGERFDAAISVNLTLRELQSAAYDFSVPPELAPQAAQGRVCELLALFVVEDNSLAGMFAFWNDVFEALRGEGFTHALATTASRILPLYRRMGALVIAETVIDGQSRHFLHFDLARTSRWVKRESHGMSASELSLPRYLVSPMPAPEQALSLVDQELGLQLARLLVVLNIARGERDEGFDLELRRRSAALIRLAIQKSLGHVATACRTAELQRALALREKQLAVIETFTEAVHSFAALARKDAGGLNLSLIESLDFLLLTALSAWDGEGGQRQILAELTREDRSQMLLQLRLNHAHDVATAANSAQHDELDEHLAHAVRMLHRLFEVAA
jgi:hypothetical protein